MSTASFAVPSLLLAIVAIFVFATVYAYVVLRWVWPWWLRMIERFVAHLERKWLARVAEEGAPEQDSFDRAHGVDSAWLAGER